MTRLAAFGAGILLLAVSGCGMRTPNDSGPKGSVTWRLIQLEKIGGNSTVVVGNPRVFDSRGRRAVLFDGGNDGLLVSSNPLIDAKSFTIEAVFRPDPGGNEEQHWLNIREYTGDDRVLLAINLVNDRWYLDTYIKSGEEDRALSSGDFKHPLGKWYHVALVFDGKTMRHYVDGREEMSGPLAIPPLEDGRTAIGMRTDRVYWFKGAVSKVRFTPGALHPGEFMGME